MFLVALLPRSLGQTSANSKSTSQDLFPHFDEYTELSVYPEVQFWMSCNEHDDMHFVVQIRKAFKDGRLLEHLNYNCPVAVEDVSNVSVAKILGPQGFLCESNTISQENGSLDGQEVFYEHDRRAPITPGTIVPLDITL